MTKKKPASKAKKASKKAGKKISKKAGKKAGKKTSKTSKKAGKKASKKAGKKAGKKASASGKATSTAKGSRVAKSIRDLKPGWTSRVFGIETGRLIACDAAWNGSTWERRDSFRFLYRSKRGKYFLLTDVQTWVILEESVARGVFSELAEKLVTRAQAFEPIEIERLTFGRDEDEDERAYKVVRNDNWDFSIWLDYKELPRGWYFIGVAGAKGSCLEFINQNCIFGAPNPGIP